MKYEFTAVKRQAAAVRSGRRKLSVKCASRPPGPVPEAQASTRVQFGSRGVGVPCGEARGRWRTSLELEERRGVEHGGRRLCAEIGYTCRGVERAHNDVWSRGAITASAAKPSPEAVLGLNQ